MNFFKTLLKITFTLLIPVVTSGQDMTTNSKKAIEAYDMALRNFSMHHYAVAEEQLLSAIQTDAKFIEAYMVLAEVYEEWGKPLQAIETYNKGLALNEKFYPYAFIRLANIQFGEGLYGDALNTFRHYLSLQTDNAAHIQTAHSGIGRCEFAVNLMEHPVDFHPVNLGVQVNSAADDYWPSLSADEKTLVITRLVDSDEFMKKFQEDFYISEWTDSSWSIMKNAGQPLNTGDNEGAQTISGDGRYMIFTACNRSDGLGRCDLYSSVKQGDRWLIPKNLGTPVNTKYRETQPSITSDGRTLYFSSDRPGGKGNHDLWVSHRESDGSWTAPENLGDSINTSGIEMSPFIHQDNRTLYFSSDGLPGLGGYDLFISRCDSLGKWQKPVNMGYPINTNRDEIGLIVNSRGNKAYYSSDMEGNSGKDIYVFDMPVEKRPEIVTYMKGKVFDAETNRRLKAEFELTDLETGIVMFNAFSDSITGEFLVSIPVNRNYMLNVSKKSYLFYSENFSLEKTFDAGKPFLKDIPLNPIMAGKSIVLKNVFFETASYALKSESKIELNKVVRLLQANPDIKIEIGGHTDNVGNKEYNQQLSEDRAKSVAGYLISASINADRIKWKGYGLNVPVSDNDTPEGRSQNRRTEMSVVE